ncbi:MAG: hypothetical protein WCC10_09175 [Tumebacillaceae bacterium]
MTNKNRIVSLAVVALLLAGGAAVSMKKDTNSMQQAIPQTNTYAVSHSDRPVYSDLKDLREACDLIFVGTVEGTTGTRNLARDPKNPELEDPNVYSEGIDYKVKVDEVLKGQADSSVTVIVQKQSKPGPDKPMQIDEHYIPLDAGGAYIFFVRKSTISNRYFSAGDPFFFKIENNKAVLKSTEKELLKIYQPQDLNVFKKVVKEGK